MIVRVLHECGYEQAMLGLSLSFDKPVGDMPKVAEKMYCKEGGHNKFLESIVVWLDVTAPRYWWQQMDTYRTGVTKQSESTMHTMMKRELTQDDFQLPLHTGILTWINMLIRQKQFDKLKATLPEGFLQRRILCTNYQTLRRIIKQRRDHRLKEWQYFIEEIMDQLHHQEFLTDVRAEFDASLTGGGE